MCITFLGLLDMTTQMHVIPNDLMCLFICPSLITKYLIILEEKSNRPAKLT